MIQNTLFLNEIEILNVLWNLIRAFNKAALIHAVINGNKEIVELLLRQENIDINIRDILNHQIFIIDINIKDILKHINIH